METEYNFKLFIINPIIQNRTWNRLQIIKEIVKLYLSFKILKIKFKSLLKIFFFNFSLKILIVKNSYTTKATGQIIMLGCIYFSVWVSIINRAETKKPNDKLPESPINCFGKNLDIFRLNNKYIIKKHIKAFMNFTLS